jgi:argininosuccinate lyase
LAELPVEEFRLAHAALDETVYKVLGVRNAVEAMVSHGSTGPEQVKRQTARWKERLKKDKRDS